MSDFKLNFSCTGDRSCKYDANGHEIAQLRTIEDKYRDPVNHCMVYGVIWWERDGTKDWLYPVEVGQLERDYPDLVKQWEDEFSEKWELENLKDEKLWIPYYKDSSEHRTTSKSSATSTIRDTSAKRQHEDTPNKAKQDPTKKSKAAASTTDEEAETVASEDDQDMDSNDGPVPRKKDIFDLPSDDSSPIKGPTSRGTMNFPFQPNKSQNQGKNRFSRLVKNRAPLRAKQPIRQPVRPSGASSSKRSPPPVINSSEEEEDSEESSDDQILPQLPARISTSKSVKSGNPASKQAAARTNINRNKVSTTALGSPVLKRVRVSGQQITLTSRPAPSSSPIKPRQKVQFDISEESEDEGSDGTPGRDEKGNEEVDSDQAVDVDMLQDSESGQQSHGHPGLSSEDDENDQEDPLPSSPPTANVADVHRHPSTDPGSDLQDEDTYPINRTNSPDHLSQVNPIDEQASPNNLPQIFSSDVFEAAEIAFAETQIEQEGIDLDEEPPVQQTQIRGDGEDSVYNIYSECLIHALDQGVDSLIRTTMNLTGMPCDGWVAKRKASNKCQYGDLLHSLWLMVLSWEPLVLRHVVHGNLPQEENRNPELKKALRAMNENLPKTKTCPSTYANYLVDKNGVATTVDETRALLDMSELYVAGLNDPDDDSGSHELAAMVDAALPSKLWGPRSAKEGKRRYIESTTQSAKCIEWVKASRERLRGLPGDEPLARPLCEVGFAKTPYERLAQHASHTSSNYLMNLAEAICMVHDDLKKYRIKQYVIHNLAHHTHAMYDEILASRFALAYTSQGGGFSHYPAGISYKGADEAEKEHYNAQQQLLARDPNFSKRIEEQLDKMRAVTEFYETFNKVSNEHRAAIENMALAARALDAKCDEVIEQQRRERLAWAELTDPILDFMESAEELEKEMEDWDT